MQKKRGRRLLALTISLFLASFVLHASAEGNPDPEDAVAVVNESVITKADFDRQVDRVQQQYTNTGTAISDSQSAEIKKAVLENLINGELLYQESRKEGIEIDEVAIDKHLATVKERFPSEAEFEDALKKMDMSEADIQSKFRRGKAIEQLIDEQVIQKITVSDEDTKNYYDTNKDLFKQPEQVQASHILIKVDPGADESQKAQAREKLEEIQQKLQKGEDFAALAKEFSQCPSGANGGDLGFFGKGQMVKPFEEAAFDLGPGEVSDIVETDFGYHVIKVADKKAETTMAYEDVKDNLGQYLKQQKIQKEVDLYINKLRASAKVERFLTEEPQ